MAEALEATRRSVVCLYAESSGWGRAALAACRAAAVPTVAVQHGILYPAYYSYRHGADEADCPRPDRTAVFGESARKILVELGHYAPESLVVTGSPKFVELLHAADALVTVESLSAVEALVLGRPVVVLNMPTHLRELVAAGAALGVAAGADPTPALRGALFDEAVRRGLEQSRQRYVRYV